MQKNLVLATIVAVFGVGWSLISEGCGGHSNNNGPAPATYSVQGMTMFTSRKVLGKDHGQPVSRVAALANVAGRNVVIWGVKDKAGRLVRISQIALWKTDPKGALRVTFDARGRPLLIRGDASHDFVSNQWSSDTHFISTVHNSAGTEKVHFVVDLTPTSYSAQVGIPGKSVAAPLYPTPLSRQGDDYSFIGDDSSSFDDPSIGGNFSPIPADDGFSDGIGYTPLDGYDSYTGVSAGDVIGDTGGTDYGYDPNGVGLDYDPGPSSISEGDYDSSVEDSFGGACGRAGRACGLSTFFQQNPAVKSFALDLVGAAMTGAFLSTAGLPVLAYVAGYAAVAYFGFDAIRQAVTIGTNNLNGARHARILNIESPIADACTSWRAAARIQHATRGNESRC